MRIAFLVAAGLAFASTTALRAQESGPWQLRTRIVMTGSSTESEPAGWQVYSAITLEAGVRRALTRAFAFELSARTESREVDLDAGGVTAAPQGSVELLPVTLALLYAPERASALRIYAGAGINATIAWEKSGPLNDADLTPQVGPALQLGVDWRVSGRAFLNADLRWNTLRPELQRNGERIADLTWDTLALGLGLGVRL